MTDLLWNKFLSRQKGDSAPSLWLCLFTVFLDPRVLWLCLGDINDCLYQDRGVHPPFVPCRRTILLCGTGVRVLSVDERPLRSVSPPSRYCFSFLCLDATSVWSVHAGLRESPPSTLDESYRSIPFPGRRLRLAEPLPRSVRGQGGRGSISLREFSCPRCVRGRGLSLVITVI